MFRTISLGTIGLMVILLSTQFAHAKEAVDDEICATRVQNVCGGAFLGKCFQDDSKWSEVGAECEGAVQTLIENEREAIEQGAGEITAIGMDGIAYGGKLRTGPGMDTAKKASIKIGDRITVLEDSGIWMNNYKWFKVKTPRGTGYLWGGIFCIPGDVLPDGVADNCQMLNNQ